MRKVLAIILGGGRGTRLYPLTRLRAKPAVPLAGKYRLIDIPVSNCINSGIQKMYVLTQFNSASLNRHIARTYSFSPLSEGFVEILAAQQTHENSDWFQGTADAVRQYVATFAEHKIDEFLILSGDHLYRMDYRPFIHYHRESGADVTISVVPVSQASASDFGILKINRHGDVQAFREKPKEAQLLEMAAQPGILGLDETLLQSKPFIASMGIYVFRKEVLTRLLQEKSRYKDFSKEIIPSAVHDLRIKAYLHKAYWEDIGTIESFYNANMQLLNLPAPTFTFFDVDFPVYTRPRFLPPSMISDCHVVQSMICDGCIITGADIQHSIIGIRSRIDRGGFLEDCLVMGADYYQTMEEVESDITAHRPFVGIGAGCRIKRAIVDKNARIGKNVTIINREQIQDASRKDEGIWISKGIVIITKDAVVADGTTI